jgi:hypothetical protein
MQQDFCSFRSNSGHEAFSELFGKAKEGNVTHRPNNGLQALTLEFGRLRVGDNTTNHQNDCDPNCFLQKESLAVRLQRFVGRLTFKSHQRILSILFYLQPNFCLETMDCVNMLLRAS